MAGKKKRHQTSKRRRLGEITVATRGSSVGLDGRRRGEARGSRCEVIRSGARSGRRARSRVSGESDQATSKRRRIWCFLAGRRAGTDRFRRGARVADGAGRIAAGLGLGRGLAVLGCCLGLFSFYFLFLLIKLIHFN